MSSVTRQKGLASSTPSFLKRWLVSKIMTFVGSEKRLQSLRKKAEAKRLKQGRKHTVEYFHQVDDGYSHLAIQLLSGLTERYDVELKVHLVPALKDENFPEPDLLHEMSRSDASNIAPYYGLEFPQTSSEIEKQTADLAVSILCHLDVQQFITVGPAVSQCLWQGDSDGLKALSEEHGTANSDVVSKALEDGAKRRAQLKHYSGAMFHYEGEWYWGVDRFYHLEQRLRLLDAAKEKHSAYVAPKPDIPSSFPQSAAQLTLEYYPSLRSPYTAVSWQPTMQLAKDSGVNLVVRPVLPMVMRGVPVTLPKAMYIFTDAAREARALGVDYDKFYDPIGDPVSKGYSLYMWAKDQDKGNAFFGAFLSAAFARGINTNSREGLRDVVEMAGLDWQQAKEHINDDTWQSALEQNRQAMYGFGSWGVPSYRLLDADGNEIISGWGQDRLWLVGQKILENSEG